MGRSGYSDDCDGWALIRWRGAVAAAVRGARGQQLLRELAAALDAMPDKRLIADQLQEGGEYCALGALGAARGMDMAGIDPDDRQAVAQAFGCATALAAEIMFENDDRGLYDLIEVEVYGPLRPWEHRMRRLSIQAPDDGASRWRYMRAWVQKHIKEPT